VRDDAPDFDGVRGALERSGEQIERVAIAQIHRACTVRSQMIEMLGPTQQRVELHRACRPAGGVASQELQQRERSLAPPIAQRVRHLAARHQDPVAQPALERRDVTRLAAVVHGLIPDQVGQVGNDPIVAGLDEPVVVGTPEVVFDHAGLLVDHSQQRAQRKALVGVPHPIDDRQQLIEAIGCAIHDLISCRIRVSGTSGAR
jgi:hypothetical protein